MVIGNFTSENLVAFKLAHDGTRVADDFTGAVLNGFLGFGVAVKIIDSVLKTGRGDVMKESGKSLFFVVGEVPNNECDGDAVREN